MTSSRESHVPGIALKALRLVAEDNVAVALSVIGTGDEVLEGVVALADIAPGHKIAIVPIARNAEVIKYGQVIGIATDAIAAGDHVHNHNLSVGEGAGSRRPASLEHKRTEATRSLDFLGFERSSGRVGTRNQIGILASVNCSATVVHEIARRARQTLLPRFRHVDGVVPIAHQSGCGIDRADPGFAVLERTMHGFLTHPNFGAVLTVGLGCEVMGIGDFESAELDPTRHRRMNIQDAGGTASAIDKGLRELETLMLVADRDRRQHFDASHLVLGLQCGGSDGLSGITANPAMGLVVDRIVAAGGAALLSETPEILGAEHLLLARAMNGDVADRLAQKVAWWLDYARRHGITLDNNPSPGNKQGGLTTILEKSLGAIAKSGQTPLRDVIDYAEAVKSPGLSFMDSPGFDPCSATGQVASGANLLLFSTGRGSCFGCQPTPSIKLSSNSEIYARMRDDIDVDCGAIVTGTPISRVADLILAKVLAVASGEQTSSETLGYGDHEFVPWRLGAVL